MKCPKCQEDAPFNRLDLFNVDVDTEYCESANTEGSKFNRKGEVTTYPTGCRYIKECATYKQMKENLKEH